MLKLNTYHQALLKVHFTAILFGLSGVLGVMIQSSSDTLVLGRAIIALTSIFLFFLWRKRKLTPLSLKERSIQFFSGALLALHWVSFYLGVKIGGVAVGTLGFASFPAFVALFEMMAFKERLRIKEYILLVAITIGLILVTPEFEFSNQATQGLLWGIFSAIAYAVLAVLNRKTVSKLSGLESSFWQYLAVSLILLPFSGTSLLQASVQDWFWIGCIGILCTTFAYTLYVSSLTHINARTASMIISLEPVYAIVIAWLWFGDAPSLKMIIGGAIILLSVMWANLKR